MTSSGQRIAPQYRVFSKNALLAGFIGSLIFASVLYAADKPPSQKIDRAVRAAVAAGVTRQNVIITVNPGCRTAVRQAMQQHGATIKSEHSLIEAISGEIQSSDATEFAKDPCVRAVSIDAPVHSTSTVQTSTLRDTLGLPHNSKLDS